MKSSSRRAVIVKKPEGSGSGTRRYLGNLHHKGDTPEVTKIVERAMSGPDGSWIEKRRRVFNAIRVVTSNTRPRGTIAIIRDMKRQHKER